MNKQDVMEIIEALAAKLGVASSQLLEWQIQKMIIDWWAGAAVSFLLAIGFGWLGFWGFIQNDKKGGYKGTDMYLAPAILGSLIAIVSGIAFAVYLGSVSVLIAPEASAVNQLIRILR